MKGHIRLKIRNAPVQEIREIRERLEKEGIPIKESSESSISVEITDPTSEQLCKWSVISDGILKSFSPMLSSPCIKAIEQRERRDRKEEEDRYGRWRRLFFRPTWWLNNRSLFDRYSGRCWEGDLFEEIDTFFDMMTRPRLCFSGRKTSSSSDISPFVEVDVEASSDTSSSGKVDVKTSTETSTEEELTEEQLRNILKQIERGENVDPQVIRRLVQSELKKYSK